MPVAQFTTPVDSHTLRTIALYDVLHFAIENEQPLVILYATQGIEDKARVVVPYDLHETKAGADVIKAHDSLTNRITTFRVDRIKSAHHLMTI